MSEQLCIGASVLRSVRSDSHLITESYLCIVATNMLHDSTQYALLPSHFRLNARRVINLCVFRAAQQ